MIHDPFKPDDTEDLFETLDQIIAHGPKRARATAKGLRQALEREINQGGT